MSQRTERRETERAARKLAYQQLRQKASATEQAVAPPQTPPSDSGLLAKAQAFFDCSEPVISEAQMKANCANAKRSTGPSTPLGKAVSARNNTRHGLAADVDGDGFRVLPTEDQSSYDQKLAAFRAEWKPTTATEHDLVNRMVMHQWLRLRALRLQETFFDPQTGHIADLKKFELYRRYETSHERGFNKVSADMQRLRAFQFRQQNGFESQKRKNEEHTFKINRLKQQETQRLQKISGAHMRSVVETQTNHPEMHHKNAA